MLLEKSASYVKFIVNVSECRAYLINNFKRLISYFSNTFHVFKNVGQVDTTVDDYISRLYAHYTEFVQSTLWTVVRTGDKKNCNYRLVCVIVDGAIYIVGTVILCKASKIKLLLEATLRNRHITIVFYTLSYDKSQ